MKKLPFWIPLFLALLLAGCNLPGRGTQGGAPAPAEFDTFGSLASGDSAPISAQVGPAASVVQLGEGASLQVPAGAFSAPNTLQVTRVVVAFDQMTFDVLSSRFYEISVSGETGALAAPVVLEVPLPTTDVTVVEFDGQTWQPVTVAPGETTRVEIDHFSSRLYGVLEWFSEKILALEQSQDPAYQQPSKLQQFIEDKGDANTHGFFGVGEVASQSQEDMCKAITTMLAAYNTPKNREFPSGSNWRNIDLGTFLHSGSSPSAEGGYFWNLTKDSQDKIQSAVLASTGPLSPADLLKIAVDANGGNVPLGVLAAHNYLKQIKYQGLTEFKPGHPFPAQWGEPAGHLASWRTESNINPAGEYDKMGPLYHIFAAMTAEVWFSTPVPGMAVIDAEAFLRTFRIGADRPDLEKAYADQCGVDAGLWLRGHSPEEPEAQPPVNSGSNDGGSPNVVGNWHGAACDEAEGTFIYRWSVDLMKDPASGQLLGVIKFHDCPGGGRVLYYVSGAPPAQTTFTLTGEKMEGGGDLFNSAQDTVTFTFDSAAGEISPNLAP